MNVPNTRPQMPSAGDLLNRLRTMESARGGFTTLVLISVSVLPLSAATDEFWEELDEAMWSLRERFDGAVYEVTRPERALLVRMTEFNQLGIISDIKVVILRLIQKHFPEQFGLVDQSRLIRNINLRLKLNNAIKYLEAVEERVSQIESVGDNLRPLLEEDIDTVKQVSQELGPAQFSQAFIRHQSIAVIEPGVPPSDVMHEYFVAVGELNKQVFKRVDMRGSGNIFNQLTLALDQVLLTAFDEVNPSRAKCSINLNVESVFTDSFSKFLDSGDEQVFSNIVFEFRQAIVLQHYDEFMVASELIQSKNGTICIDAIFPESVGIVSLARLNAAMGKIFWRNGAEATLPAYKDEIRSLQKDGINIVLARVDDEQGLQLGQEMGIVMFQGFYIDDLIEKRRSGQ